MDLPAKNDIEKISLDVLKASKTYGVFPTPVDAIASYSNLVIKGGIDINNLEKSYPTFSFCESFKAGWSKIRGFL